MLFLLRSILHIYAYGKAIFSLQPISSYAAHSWWKHWECLALVEANDAVITLAVITE